MKKALFTIAISLLFVACNSQKGVSNQEQLSGQVSVEENDSMSYELVVFDPRYENYLATQPHPKWYYSNEYYQSWNIRYTVEWNIRFNDPMRYGSFYECHIPYESHIDYGIDFNYRLYHYFQFIEKEYGIVLISRRGS
jgi:hypothetical protein